MRADRAAGFTLLEVLGAVAILGITYTMLAGTALQHVREEGESERRLQAAMRAEQAVLDIEAQAIQGTAPPMGRTESSDGDFSLVLDVEPLELTLPEGELRPGASAIPGTEASDRGSILTARDRRGDPALRRVHVIVSWIDGVNERSVKRTTYAFDRAVVAELVEGLGGEPGGLDDAGDDGADGAADPASRGEAALPNGGELPDAGGAIP